MMAGDQGPGASNSASFIKCEVRKIGQPWKTLLFSSMKWIVPNCLSSLITAESLKTSVFSVTLSPFHTKAATSMKSYWQIKSYFKILIL